MFDLVVSQDVMEHIYNPQKSFLEIARTLKKGGAYIFTVPILNKHKKTEVWANKGIDGNPVFINKSEWHGNQLIQMVHRLQCIGAMILLILFRKIVD